MTKTTNQQPEPAVNEYIKASSNYLRGTIIEGLQDYVTGSISAKDQQLLKFHGIYQQDDRDVRMERKKQKLEPAYGFMIRVRVPGGIFSPECWQLMDELASQYGHDNFRLTTRQAFQLHGVLKKDLKPTIQNINQKLMDTIAACGDVNRNVMCSVAPQFGRVYEQVYDYSCQVSAHLTPRSNAYHEIWLDGQKITAENDSNEAVEPIYGKTYLPRKFKIGFVIPPINDIDVFSQDIGFVAVTENDQLTAFNVVVGGGMGNTHGDTTTYPCVGVTIGACQPDEVVEVAEKIVTIQRDYGNRSNRKRARLKYTIEECGLDWFKQELENRSGISLAAAHTVSFQTSGDDYGWHYHRDGTAHLTLFVPQGRVIDHETLKLRTGLKALADKHQGKMILTPNQNVTLAHIKPEEQARIQAIVDQYDLINQHGKLSATRQRALACVAMPTCGLAMAEAERYLPDFVDQFDHLLEKHGLAGHEVSVRITGCPNGCARPYLAEVGLVGKAPGLYNCYLGGSPEGYRLNKLFLESVNETKILQSIEPIIADYAHYRNAEENFGDFSIRRGYITEVTNGSDFHANT